MLDEARMEHKSFITFYKFPVTAFLQFYLAFEDDLRLATYDRHTRRTKLFLNRYLGFITTSESVSLFIHKILKQKGE